MKIKIWCTNCDKEMLESGIALDCPSDGIFYICPSCNYRIVIFLDLDEGIFIKEWIYRRKKKLSSNVVRIPTDLELKKGNYLIKIYKLKAENK